jgi:hypothetical protein
MCTFSVTTSCLVKIESKTPKQLNMTHYTFTIRHLHVGERTANGNPCVPVLVTTGGTTHVDWDSLAGALSRRSGGCSLHGDLGVVVQVYAREKATIQAALGSEE